jgi:hypothetical protein
MHPIAQRIMTIHPKASGSSLITIRPRQRTVEISRGRTVLVTDEDVSVAAERADQGVYIYQARVLCRYAWLMNGKRPELSCGLNIEQFSWLGYYVQAPHNWRETPTADCDPLQEALIYSNMTGYRKFWAVTSAPPKRRFRGYTPKLQRSQSNVYG